MTMTTLCIYHGNCADGFTAAWAVRKALGASNVEFFPGVYQNPPPDVSGKDVILVDFSYKRATIEAMADVASSVLILDHHKSAINDLAGIDDRPNVKVVFDIERSGAMIAWQYFNASTAIPRLVRYVQDRDLWLFKMDRSREFSANLFSHSYNFHTWDRIAKDIEDDGGLAMFIMAGVAIERKHHKDVEELVNVAKRRMVIGGHDVPVANLPYTLSSDAGHLMGDGEPFAACYMDGPEGRTFSLRSSPDGLDVSEIAKLYGGGGHKHAAGFRVAYGTDIS